MKTFKCEYCIIGAGPAGLTAALELLNRGKKNVVIIEKNNKVGGLARTEKRNGVRFDIGPHRFFTKNREILELWKDILKDDFIEIDRITRIHYKGKFFCYPIKLSEVVKGLGTKESIYILLSYLKSKITLKRNLKTFEDWITSHFGKVLFKIFFKTYTEKIWGIPCNKIGAEWASQRIGGLSLFDMINNALPFDQKNKSKSLIDKFYYPKYGAGQMYEKIVQRIIKKGGKIIYNTHVNKFNAKNNRIISIETKKKDSVRELIRARNYINSSPLNYFFKNLYPKPGEDVLGAANKIYFRDHISVNFLIDCNNIFPDQWIYIHSKDVKMARLVNYSNFSDEMTTEKNKTVIGTEYFVFRGDSFWNKNDMQIIDFARKELRKIGLFNVNTIEDAWVNRETDCYPVYYLGYSEPYSILQKAVSDYVNLQPIGRGGLYKYNNQDHSMLSGLLSAQNYLNSNNKHDIWKINIDAEYNESIKRATK